MDQNLGWIDDVEWQKRKDEIQEEIKDLKLQVAFHYKQNLESRDGVFYKSKHCSKVDGKTAFMIHYEHCPMYKIGVQKVSDSTIDQIAKELVEMRKDIATIKNKI